jgi:hypothetical protein
MKKNVLISPSITMIRFVLVSIALSLFVVMNSPVHVNAQSSVAITQPSGMIAQGEDLEYATHDWHDAWDMNEETDLYLFSSPTCNQVSPMFANSTFSNGLWSATFAVANPYLWLIHPGYPSALHVGKDGNVHPIDANLYTQLTFRMYLAPNFDPSQTPGGFLGWTPAPGDVSNVNTSNFGESRFFRVYPGWNTYTIDLTKIGLQQGNLNWGGQISGLMLFPAFLPAGTTIQIDWVRLTAAQSQSVAWRGTWQSGSTAVLSFSSDNVNFNPLRIYSNYDPYKIQIIEPNVIPAGNNGVGSYDVPASFMPGSAYVKVSISGQTSVSAGPLQPNARPDFTFVAPSYTSGEEFASSVVGNPWDMSDAADVSSWDKLVSPPAFSSGILTATSVSDPPNCGMPWGDPKLFLNMGGKSVDTNYYRYLTIKVKMNASFDFGNGWVSRFYWVRNNYYNYGGSNDMPLYSGWNIFNVDLWGNVQDDAAPGNAAWRSISPNILRFDPHEIPPSTQFEIDYIKLTANDTAQTGSTLWIKYLLSSSYTPTFYYDTDRNAANGRTIAGSRAPVTLAPKAGPSVIFLPLVTRNFSQTDPPGTRTFGWNLTGVPAGAYYISADVNDGYNTTTWYSETPAIITN